MTICLQHTLNEYKRMTLCITVERLSIQSDVPLAMIRRTVLLAARGDDVPAHRRERGTDQKAALQQSVPDKCPAFRGKRSRVCIEAATLCSPRDRIQGLSRFLCADFILHRKRLRLHSGFLQQLRHSTL